MFVAKVKELAQDILAESQDQNYDLTGIMAKAMSIITLCDVITPDTPQSFGTTSYCGSPRKSIPSIQGEAPVYHGYSNNDSPDFSAANKEQHR